MTDEEILEGFGPDPRTFDPTELIPIYGRPYPEARPEDYRLTKEAFRWFADRTRCHAHCLLTACKRSRRCTAPRMADCLDIFHSASYPGMLIREGVPLCIAIVWKVIQPDFMRILEQSVADDAARGKI